MSFTKRSGTRENKVYEKLRKRSYRNYRRMVKWGFDPLIFRIDHENYLNGVRDAIKELRSS